jgi:hypothetical protein
VSSTTIDADPPRTFSDGEFSNSIEMPSFEAELIRQIGGRAMSALGILTVLLPGMFAFSWLLWRAST